MELFTVVVIRGVQRLFQEIVDALIMGKIRASGTRRGTGNLRGVIEHAEHHIAMRDAGGDI